MKKIKIIIAITFLGLIISCSKDDAAPANFSEIKMSDIQSKKSLLLAANIQTTDANGLLWATGTVVIFKTNSGVYGKFEVVNINPELKKNALTLNVVLFNADGTVKTTTNNIVVQGGSGCDLDIPEGGITGLKSDFTWDISTVTDTFLSPKNGAIFLKL